MPQLLVVRQTYLGTVYNTVPTSKILVILSEVLIIEGKKSATE